jgi:hypothetical protein
MGDNVIEAYRHLYHADLITLSMHGKPTGPVKL